MILYVFCACMKQINFCQMKLTKVFKLYDGQSLYLISKACIETLAMPYCMLNFHAKDLPSLPQSYHLKQALYPNQLTALPPQLSSAKPLAQ